MDTLVVTHFDADHWEGLRLLAENLRFLARPTMKLYYPRLPDRAPKVADATFAMLVTSRFSGTRPLELATALESVAKVVRHPLARGNEFEAGQRRWEVMWPPEQLSPGLWRRLERAVREAEELAQRLDRAGFPMLRANLEEAYERPFPGGDDTTSHYETGRNDGWADDAAAWDLGQQQRQSRGVRSATGSRHRERPGKPANGVHGLDAVSSELIPSEFRGAFIETSKRLAAANNDISLVFHDRHSSLAVFGDASRQVLRSALRGMDSHYRVVLAPHHGTYRLPSAFPSADVCIAQAGDSHAERWPTHLADHKQRRSCVNTARVGTISVW
nr:hypothetical protein [Micromonospora globispora]